MPDLTDVLDLVGIALLIAAAYVIGGLGVALVVAAACTLALSYTITRAKRRGAQ